MLKLSLDRAASAVDVVFLQLQEQQGNGDGDEDRPRDKAGVPVVDVLLLQHPLWAPLAETAALRLYRSGDGGRAAEVCDMSPAGRGMWVYETRRNLDGVYYDYEVFSDGISRVTADPYAKACGLNGQRSMVIDLRRTDPPGWAFDSPPPPQPETVIYEIHVKDFNWGYDPVNYNVPEGSYATDPRRGEVRIRELKEAIQSLHQNGFRVILDVVYNHTYLLDSWLWRTAPWYYYRQWEDGGPSNGSGCGNDMASERSMCARYILDSVLYWAEEYHVDGFRFDLWGCLV